MEANFYDKVAFTIAQSLDFECYKLRNHGYSFRKDCAGNYSPPLYGTAAGPNPCSEIPLGYFILCITIVDCVFIINGVLKFDLNDPTCIDEIKAEFQDLTALSKKIQNLLKQL